MNIDDQIKTFQKLYNVSRETIDLLSLYHSLLLEEQQKVSLVGSGTLKNIWLRHFADSAKLVERIIQHSKKIKKPVNICDAGSGAGFPGIVCLLLLSERGSKISMSLIESSSKKCKFLGLVKKELKLPFLVVNKRIEESRQKFDLILSRALAPLSILLKLLADLGGGKSILLLPKGKNWLKEVNEAKKIWYFSYNAVKNNRILDNSGGVTLEIKGLRPKKN